MPRACPTVKKSKEYAKEVTYVPKRSRRGHVRHHTIDVTPSSSQFSSSPAKNQDDEEDMDIIPSLSFSRASSISLHQDPISVDHHHSIGMQQESSHSIAEENKSSRRGKAWGFIHITQIRSQLISMIPRHKMIS
jgi:hypothetical protein